VDSAIDDTTAGVLLDAEERGGLRGNRNSLYRRAEHWRVDGECGRECAGSVDELLVVLPVLLDGEMWGRGRKV
jgi:hypothetical protein